jgi:hypothetical protein
MDPILLGKARERANNQCRSLSQHLSFLVQEDLKVEPDQEAPCSLEEEVPS